jgi:hypothetical protein
MLAGLSLFTYSVFVLVGQVWGVGRWLVLVVKEMLNAFDIFFKCLKIKIRLMYITYLENLMTYSHVNW